MRINGKQRIRMRISEEKRKRTKMIKERIKTIVFYIYSYLQLESIKNPQTRDKNDKIDCWITGKDGLILSGLILSSSLPESRPCFSYLLGMDSSLPFLLLLIFLIPSSGSI